MAQRSHFFWKDDRKKLEEGRPKYRIGSIEVVLEVEKHYFRDSPCEASNSLPNLTKNRPVLYLPILCQQHRLTNNDRQHVVAFERKKYFSRLIVFSVGDNTEVLVVGFHQYITATNMDFVGTQIAFYQEVSTIKGTSRSYFESGHQIL